MKISEVLKKYDTDKNKKVKDEHCYGKAYDHILKKFDREAVLDIIEVGTFYGESLRAWRECFPNANITGLDIIDVVEDKNKTIKYELEDIKKYKPQKKFDIVIDDGSHKIEDVLHTIKNIKFKVGGIMVIEDVQKPIVWFEKIKKLVRGKYSIELIDLRRVNKRYDDYMIVLRNYGYTNK